jgi:hypothetical protein
VALGAALRLRQYLSRRSLWNDEAALALNVVERSYRELLKPLDIDQGAPLGFLWAQRTAVNLLGNNEYALRLVPLLGGVAALVLVALLARRLLSPLAAAAAILLVAVLGPLVYFSAEAKQYSTDVAVTLLLIYATVRLLDGPVSLRRTLAWGAVGCASLLFSHPAILVVAACSVAAALVLVARRAWRRLPVLMAGAVVWGGGLAGLYVVSLRKLAANPNLEAYWQEGFAPRPLRFRSTLRWVVDVGAGLVPDPIELSAPIVVLVLAAAGAGVLLLRRPPAGLMVLGVAGAALMAGLVGAYPLKSRLALYLVPVVVLAMAAALDAVTRPRIPALAFGALAAVGLAVTAVHPVSEAIDAARRPYTVTEMRSVLVRMKAAMEPSDVVYVHWTGVVLYKYYTPVLDLPELGGYFAFEDRFVCAQKDELDPLRAHPRVWVVFAYPPGFDPADNAATALTHFDRLGKRIDERTAPGAVRAVLYATGEAPNQSPLGRTPRPDQCFIVVPG